MTIAHSIQKGVSDFSSIIGKGMMYGGGAGLFFMVCVGTISIDLVLLKYAEKNHNDFLTGWILGSMFFRPDYDPLPLLIASPISSTIAIGLSFALGVPNVGVAILAGWAASTLLLGLGYGVAMLAQEIKPEEIEYTPCAVYAM